MRITPLPVIHFHGRWWIDWSQKRQETVMFFPEERKAFALSELQAIVKEMEKMDDIHPE